jgi:hypothetical protein
VKISRKAIKLIGILRRIIVSVCPYLGNIRERVWWRGERKEIEKEREGAFGETERLRGR